MSIGTATFSTQVLGADTLTQKIDFGVTKSPSGALITNDASLCVVTTSGNDIDVEFPVYDDAADPGSSYVYTMRVSNYDGEGENIGPTGERFFTEVNVSVGDTINQ